LASTAILSLSPDTDDISSNIVFILIVFILI
jgi:hypothetical protein